MSIEQIFISDEHSDIIIDKDGLRFALAEGDNKKERAERARRIAACFNACTGLSTDDLEKSGLISAVGNQLIELESERDALKARIDKGVRVWARGGAFNGIWADTVNYADRRNAILIIDEDAMI